MVILNAALGVLLKLPSVFNSIFDWIFFINNLLDTLVSIEFHFYKLCYEDNFCFLLDKFSNILYLISISIYLIFFYHFDKNFRTSLLRLLVNKKKEGETINKLLVFKDEHTLKQT